MAESRDVSDSVHLISTASVGVSAMTAPRVGLPSPTILESKRSGRRGGARRMVRVASPPIDHRRAKPADIRYAVVRSGRRSLVRRAPAVGSQHGAEVLAGGDAELGEHLAEVPFDGAGAEEQFRGDLGVGASVSGQPGDVLLLRGELGCGCRPRACGPSRRWPAAPCARARRRPRRPSRRTGRRRRAAGGARRPAGSRGAATRRRAGGPGRGRAAAACGRAARPPRRSSCSASRRR